MHPKLPATAAAPPLSPVAHGLSPIRPLAHSHFICLLSAGFFCAPFCRLESYVVLRFLLLLQHFWGKQNIENKPSKGERQRGGIEILLCSAYVSGLACKCLASIFKYFLPSHTITSLFFSSFSYCLLLFYSHFINSIKWKLHVGEKTVGKNRKMKTLLVFAFPPPA